MMFEEKKKIESVLIHLAFGPVYHIFNKAKKNFFSVTRWLKEQLHWHQFPVENAAWNKLMVHNVWREKKNVEE